MKIETPNGWRTLEDFTTFEKQDAHGKKASALRLEYNKKTVVLSQLTNADALGTPVKIIFFTDEESKTRRAWLHTKDNAGKIIVHLAYDVELNPSEPMPEKLELTTVMLYAIMEKLAVHDAKTSARPTPSEYFRAYMITKLPPKTMRLKGWKDRTMRGRRQLVENVIAENYGSKVNLRKFRDTIDSRIFHAAEIQMEAARKHGSKAHL